MLGSTPVYTTIPVVDPERAKKFYRDVLGLRVEDYKIQGYALATAGSGTMLCLYQRPPSKADHTLASFDVPDIEAAMTDLRTRGVTFEEYDFPGLKTVNGIAAIGGDKAAWFKDSEGNILGLSQRG